MSNSLRDKVKGSVDRNIKTRDCYNQAMHEMSEELGYSKLEDRDFEEKQVLGMPASEDDINMLESTIGTPLPPSYRIFLQLHNGWKLIDGSPDFFSIPEILNYISSEDHTELLDNALIRGDDFVKSSLVIGGTEGGADKYLLNPNNINTEGEWEFIEYEKIEYEVYSSFLEFLVGSEKVYSESISEMESEEYFDPFQ